VTYQGKSFVDNANSAQLPSYVRFDLSAYRDLSNRLRVQVNVENITNERYFPNAHSLHQISVGAPRHLMFTLLGSF
jgi:catecholate siderophore receptor